MEQSTLFTLAPIVDTLLSNARDAWEAMPSDPPDAVLWDFHDLLRRLRAIRPADGSNGTISLDAFDDIVTDLAEAIRIHGEDQTRVQDALETAAQHASDAADAAGDLQTEFDDAEFEAAWAEVDRARAMMLPTFRASLDCPACHRASIGLTSDGRHDERCPARPARVAAPRPATPPTPAVAIDPATGLPPRPQTHREVMGRLYSLSERRPAAVPCTKCRTGAGKRHGKGCTAAGARAR